MKNRKLLYELGIVLFEKFVGEICHTKPDEFQYQSPGDIVHTYKFAFLPKRSEMHKTPAVVLIDHRSKSSLEKRVCVILVKNLPKIKEGFLIHDWDEFASIECNRYSVGGLAQHAQMTGSKIDLQLKMVAPQYGNCLC